MAVVDLGLAGRGALVTGAVGLIGPAIVRLLAAEGVTVAVHHEAHHDREAAEQLAAEVGGVTVAGRLHEADTARQVVRDACEMLGRLDMCVANAGRYAAPTAPVWEIEPAEWADCLRDNLATAFFTTGAYLGHASRTGRGSLVLVGSSAGRLGLAGSAHYAAAKGGVLTGLLRSAALDAAQLGDVRVNAVAPGWITDPDAAPPDPTVVAATLSTQTRARLGEPHDVASAVVWLGSGAARHVNGIVIEVDGGTTGRRVRGPEAAS